MQGANRLSMRVKGRSTPRCRHGKCRRGLGQPRPRAGVDVPVTLPDHGVTRVPSNDEIRQAIAADVQQRVVNGAEISARGC